MKRIISVISAGLLRTSSASIRGEEHQIVVSAQIAEFSLTKAQQAGIDVTELMGNPRLDMARDKRTWGVDDGGALRKLEELRQKNLVHILAAPRLVTTSGKSVTYKSGGELPVSKPTADGGMDIHFQPGIVIELTPTLKDDQTVQLKFHCTKSKLADVQPPGAGVSMPFSISCTEVVTNTELRSGQSVVLGGLKEIRHEIRQEGVPWLSEIPYVGAIFRKQKEVRNETAAIVVLTAEISPGSAVSAAAPNSSAQAAPLARMTSPLR